jgi:hypothetical protein
MPGSFMSNSKLLDIIDQINDNQISKRKLPQILKDLLILEIKNERSISILGWEFDVSIAIYSSATSSEVRSGFDFLIDCNVPLDTYLNAFLIKSIDDNLNPEQPKQYQEMIIDIKFEPEFLELIRLCYWINKCRMIIHDSFSNKFNEVKEQLELGGKDKLGTRFAKRCKIISKILLNNAIPRWERSLHKTCFLNELNKFRITVSSFLSELMLTAISKQEGFDVEFPIRADSKKVCDIVLNSFEVEVKTIFDQTKFSNTEDTLSKEVEETLTKDKVVDHINDALSKNADIVFLVLTFTSAGVSLNDHVITSQNYLSIQKTVNQAIMLSHSNREARISQRSIKEVPIVIFVTGIDVINNIYRISLLLISYPVMTINSELRAGRENLRISL